MFYAGARVELTNLMITLTLGIRDSTMYELRNSVFMVVNVRTELVPNAVCSGVGDYKYRCEHMMMFCFTFLLIVV